MLDTGKTVATLPREDAEEMVSKNPTMFGIREITKADLLLHAAIKIGNPALLALMLEDHDKADDLHRTADQKAVHEQRKKENRPNGDALEEVPNDLPKTETSPEESEAPPPAKKRDKSPKRPVIHSIAVLGAPNVVKSNYTPPRKMVNVYQLSEHNFFRIRTQIWYNFRAMFGTNGIVWSFPGESFEETQHAAFQVENRRVIKNIEDTVKGLGCTKVDYIPWTVEDHHKFSQQ